jgi:MFS family permease
MATQLLGGALADRYGGKRVMAGGIIWFSLASMLLPAALSGPVAAAGLSVPAILAARCAVGLGEGVALPSMNSLVRGAGPAAGGGGACRALGPLGWREHAAGVGCARLGRLTAARAGRRAGGQPPSQGGQGARAGPRLHGLPLR